MLLFKYLKTNKMSEKKTIKTQFGISATADFEELTWTFQMPEKYSVVAGEFALVDKILYDQLMQSIEDLSIHCQELEMHSIFLSNVAVTVKKLQGVL
jgi:hypothetical protein